MDENQDNELLKELVSSGINQPPSSDFNSLVISKIQRHQMLTRRIIPAPPIFVLTILCVLFATMYILTLYYSQVTLLEIMNNNFDLLINNLTNIFNKMVLMNFAIIILGIIYCFDFIIAKYFTKMNHEQMGI